MTYAKYGKNFHLKGEKKIFLVAKIPGCSLLEYKFV